MARAPTPKRAVATPLPVATPVRPKPRVRPIPLRPKDFVWAFPAEPPFEDEARPVRNPPPVDAAGRCFVFTQKRVFALVETERRPQVVWEYVVGSHVPGPIVVAGDGSLRIHSADGFLHAVDSAGKQLFPPAHVGEPLGSAAPIVDSGSQGQGDRDGTTWICGYRGGLRRVGPDGKPSTGLFFRSRSKFDSTGLLSGNVLYLGSEDPYLAAIDLSGPRGKNLWNPAVEQGYSGGFVNGAAAQTADGRIVVATRDDHLVGFTPEGGRAFAVKMPGQMLGSPVIDRHGHLYAGVSLAARGQAGHVEQGNMQPGPGKGLLVSVDGTSHKIRWEYTAAGAVESTPVVGDDDVVYFGDNAGMLHAIDSRGNAVWTTRVECAVRSAATIVAPNRVAFGLDDDTLVVVECGASGLSPAGWPKFGGTLGNSCLAPASTQT